MPQPPWENKAFQDMPIEFVQAICSGASTLTVQKGERILQECSRERQVFLLMSGAICLSSEKARTNSGNRADVIPNEFFGELTLLGFAEQPASAVATELSVVMLLDAEAVTKLLAAHPTEFMRNLSRGAILRLQSSTTASLRDIELVLGGLVHDLKNPISAVSGAAELIEERLGAGAAMPLGIIKRSVSRMMSLVQDVLDASRGKSSIRVGVVDIQDLMKELEELVLVPIRSRGIAINTQLEFQGRFPGDSHAMARALANIVKNAGEAMDNGGTLTIATGAGVERVFFRVTDTGPGIHPKVYAGLFDPLVSYGKEGGSGFGMTITKTIAEAHGGSVRLVETSERGTTFEMTFPKSESDN